MANIKELKKKIRSTGGTLKITTAMKLVSASKLAKAQQRIYEARPYADELENTIKTVSALRENPSHPYLKKNSSPHQALVVISANKGLCGSYNSQLAKEVMAFLSREKNVKVFFIGRKVQDLIASLVDVGESLGDDLEMVTSKLAELFILGEYGRLHVAYNSFSSAISCRPVVKTLLPMVLDKKEAASLKAQFPFDFKYEPGPQKILDILIPLAYQNIVRACELNAMAAEHGSRMVAMDNASTNCKEAIRSLSLKMNKLRQAAITTELIEVVSGAESLGA